MKLMQNVSVAVARNSARTVGIAPDDADAGANVVDERCRGRTAARSLSRLPISREQQRRRDEGRRASAAIASGAVSHATSAPPSAGPEISATASTASRLPLASSRRLRADEIGDEHVIGELESTVAMPVTTATAYSSGSVTCPQSAASGNRPAARRRGRGRRRSCSGRRRWRSTQPPPNHARIAPGSVSATVSKPRSSAPAPATRIAAIGSAVRVMREPTAEMPCALHSSRKSRCRHSPPRGQRDAAPRVRDANRPP